MKNIRTLLVAVLVTSVPASALAQTGSDYRCANAPPARGDVSNHQEFCFTATGVRGDRDLSQGTNVGAANRPHGPSLIRFRTNFVNQMLRTVEGF